MFVLRYLGVLFNGLKGRQKSRQKSRQKGRQKLKEIMLLSDDFEQMDVVLVLNLIA